MDKSTLAQATGPYSRSRVAKTAKKRKPRFGRKQLVDSGTRDRTISRFNRLKAMGVDPGVSQSQLDTGAGARAVKAALAKSKDEKPTMKTAIDFGNPRTGEGERKVPPGAVVRRYQQGKVVQPRRRRRFNRLRRGSFRYS